MVFLFLIFVVIPITAIIVIVMALSSGSDRQAPQVHSYERSRRYYDDMDDDWDDDWDYDDFDDDRESDAYFEGYQQGLMDSQRNSLVKKEKTKSESFWKPLPDYLDEYNYYCPDCDEDLIDGDCEHKDDWLY